MRGSPSGGHVPKQHQEDKIESPGVDYNASRHYKRAEEEEARHTTFPKMKAFGQKLFSRNRKRHSTDNRI